MSGTRGHSGRKRKPAAKRYGEVWVRLASSDSITVNGIMFLRFSNGVILIRWLGDKGLYKERRFDNYAAASA